MITDPYFYALAVPAVILVGLAKGGFVGAFVMLGVPLLSLMISPVQAAGIPGSYTHLTLATVLRR